METTTFADVKLTEDFNYHFENKDYSWNKGDVISLPRHTARKLVHNWDKGVWTDTPKYEVREDEYDDIAARVRNSDQEDNGGDEDVETCGIEKSDGEVCGREKPCPYHDE